MASWGLVPALTGFSYSAVERRMGFARAAGPVHWFWSTGDAWGASEQRPTDEGMEISLRVLGGALIVEHITILDVGTVPTGRSLPLRGGDDLPVVVTDTGGEPGRTALPS